MRFMIALIAISVAVAGAWPTVSFAQQPDGREVRAQVVSIEKDETIDGARQMIFLAESGLGERFHVDTSKGYIEGVRYDIDAGDKVILQVLANEDGTTTAFLVDVVRTPALLWLFLFFAALTVGVGWWRGLFALLGLGITIAILFLFVFPRILAGGDPVLITVIGSVAILAVNMHLSHGISKRTFIAFMGTVAGLILAVVFSKLFVSAAQLSGLAAEEATLLYWQSEHVKLPVGLLLAAMILGAVGVLDDIAITQSETVAELHEANPDLSRRELFVRAMRVGRHHIASTVNTLVLAYVGVAMPLFLLALSTGIVTLEGFLNTEVVAEELVRTLAGTAALVLTVPIATWLSSLSLDIKSAAGYRGTK